MCARALALWCALALCAGAAAYTVDCNHEYADCDNELSKLSADLDDTTPPVPIIVTSTTEKVIEPEPTTTTSAPTRTTSPITVNRTVNVTDVTTTTEEVTTESAKPQPRLLDLNVDDLKNFAIALHNESINTKKLADLSDVNLDSEDDYEPPPKIESIKHSKDVSDKFYSNLQAPFNPSLMGVSEEAKEEEMCRENELPYKVGERIEHGCEEICECTPGGVFDCNPRCKHPYIRRGRRLNDPLCFESPVDECCSIIACASGNDMKKAKVEICRYGNDSHIVGSNWEIGCEQRCSCEKNSVVTCKPRCKPLPQSDKCINVQDPNDACCEVQVCDVSQDVHEEPLDNSTSTTTTTTTELPSQFAFDGPMTSGRPLVLTEPIGSVKVLQNNSVQVNLMQVNNSLDPIHLLLSSDGGQNFKDVELKLDNLILNLDGGKDYILKTKETGTKFNFTITAKDFESKEVDGPQEAKKIGCHQGGVFYEVGEEFHIGCSELCECTGAETRECAALECPSHVGLELVSKGCVRWAPSPPPQPPNCCPRAARCLSDGTCHFKGVAIPNWTEVPLSLTGCEQRCFCENGDLDCQEVCTPLAPIPPQNFRCPPQHRPAPVNISDEDCCKQWGCVPNARNTSDSQTIPTIGNANFVTPVTPITSALNVIPIDNPNVPVNFYKHLSPVNAVPRIFKTFSLQNFVPEMSEETQPVSNNATVFSVEDSQYQLPQMPVFDKSKQIANNKQFNIYENPVPKYMFPLKPETSKKYSASIDNYEMNDKAMHKIMQDTPVKHPINTKFIHKHTHEEVIKNERQQYFEPSYSKFGSNNNGYVFQYKGNIASNQAAIPYFKPVAKNNSRNLPQQQQYPLPNYSQQNLPLVNTEQKYDKAGHRKHVIVLPSKEYKTLRLTDRNQLTPTDDTHVLRKLPNPYETVLMRVLPNPRYDMMTHDQRNTPLTKSYSTLDLEHLLNQMEVESEVNRNLERSADKNQRAVAGSPPSEFGGTPSLPFLPTIRPDNFPPEETTIDHKRNEVHHPVNTLLPALPGLPPGLPMQPSRGDENKKLTVISLLSDSPTSVKMLFGLPPVLVGLRGSVDLRYTEKPDDDISHWYSQVFAPADEILTTSRLEFRLTGLKPATVYKLRGKLFLHNLPVEPESEIYSIRTLEIPTIAPVEEKRREINSRLILLDVNDTVAHVSWRRFTEDELQYIDGIQVRYRPVGTPIYSMTELLHHSRAAASLHELRAGSRYEASLVLVPPPRSDIELVDHTVLEFTTTPLVDPYDWSVSVEARSVGSEAAELTWRGIPSPAERWVRVYRAAHACGAIRKEHDAFRLATREMPSGMTLTGLEPNSRCRVWLELFLSNGKVKTSNVLEINTKSVDSPEPIDNVIEASSVGGRNSPRGDYYGALVVVGVVAALGALTSLLLLLVVVRRHRPRSVPITPVPTAPRESSLPPYDNPAYKLELQQETMGSLTASTGFLNAVPTSKMADHTTKWACKTQHQKQVSME